MDLVEKLNNKFTVWYESLFGDHGNSELRPKDVLRKILHAMDDNRSEGIDGKVYVPNKYILILNLADNDERDYLLSFLDEDELSAVLMRYMAQNGYATRGPLDFTILDETIGTPGSTEKLTVKVRYEKGQVDPVPAESVEPIETNSFNILDLPTVASTPFDDLETVADVPRSWGSLAVTESDGRHSLIAVSNLVFTIGRSRTAGNDLVLPNDGKVSKVHARIELASDGTVIVTDLGSTNGIYVNGRKVTRTASILSKDTIQIGDTILLFQREADRAAPALSSPAAGPMTRSVLSSLADDKQYTLSSDNLLGRGITCDIVLTSNMASNRQAQIVAHEAGFFTIEDLSGQGSTVLNDRVLHIGERIKLTNTDRLHFAGESFEFIEKNVR